jgi:hypothetical protein
MSDTGTIFNGTETNSRFVIASEARQSSALVGQSGLPRRYAPRNDGVV